MIETRLEVIGEALAHHAVDPIAAEDQIGPGDLLETRLLLETQHHAEVTAALLKNP